MKFGLNYFNLVSSVKAYHFSSTRKCIPYLNLRRFSILRNTKFNTLNTHNNHSIASYRNINSGNNRFQNIISIYPNSIRSYTSSTPPPQLPEHRQNKANTDNDDINKDKSTDNKEKMGFYRKLKYFLIKQNRPFNIDEVTAFFSWILMGNFIWIFIGTTTFLGFLVYIIHWFDDGKFERIFLNNLLTFDNKMNVDISESNFKSSWEDGKIKLKNLKINSSNDLIDIDNNYNYKLKIDEINLTFSLNKWLDGRGLIDGIEIYGLEGDIVYNDDSFIIDESFHDNYELNHLIVKHSKINFHSVKYFNQPLELVVFNCDLDKLRRKWIVYDFLNANSMFGSLGGSLFTLHKRQHKFAHFNDMDLHNKNDDSFNNHLNKNKILMEGKENKFIDNDYMRDTNNNNNNNNTNKSNMSNKNIKLQNLSNNTTNINEYNNEYNNGNNDLDEDEENDIWKKITRLRIDMLDLSFLNNENSKLNWIKSGKAEVIFDIMLPNENESVNQLSLKKELNFEFSVDGFKKMFETIYQKLTDDDYKKNDYYNRDEQNKYVVIDMKINYYNLTAKLPDKLPFSSLTGLPYITSHDLQSLVTFINDEKFGLSSSKLYRANGDRNDFIEENPFDGSEIEDDDSLVNDSILIGSNNDDSKNMNSNNNELSDEDYNNVLNGNSMDDYDSNNKFKMLPPIKFRIVQNLNDFEYLDLPSLVTFTSMKKPDQMNNNDKQMKSFINTNKFIDSSIVEVLALLLVYKEEIQTHLIDMYAKRSGFEILFNNLILGNLILVGLGSFVI